MHRQKRDVEKCDIKMKRWTRLGGVLIVLPTHEAEAGGWLEHRCVWQGWELSQKCSFKFALENELPIATMKANLRRAAPSVWWRPCLVDFQGRWLFQVHLGMTVTIWLWWQRHLTQGFYFFAFLQSWCPHILGTHESSPLTGEITYKMHHFSSIYLSLPFLGQSSKLQSWPGLGSWLCRPNSSLIGVFFCREVATFTSQCV